MNITNLDDLNPVGTSFGVLKLVSAPTLVTLGSPPHTVHIDVLRHSKIYDTYIYELRINKTIYAILGDADKSRGSSVRINCAGRKERALIISGEFTANALEGVVFTYNNATKQLERLNFAEKSRPTLLYQNAHQIQLVIPTHGYGETNKKFAIYSHHAGDTHNEDAVGSDVVPPENGFAITHLK